MLIDDFVNNNPANVTNIDGEGNAEAVENSFTAMVKEFDTINDEAFPVLVYLHGKKHVAWVDLENAVGFIG